MGNSDSKLVFKQGIFKLSEPQPISAGDIFWTGFWKLPESAEDVFSLFSISDVRRCRDNSLTNIETLLNSLVARLIALRHLPSFPDTELAPGREALNCIRVITRVLPFLYEVDHLESWVDKFFWQRRRRQTKDGANSKVEVLFDDSNSKELKKEEETEDDTTEYTRPVGEELIDALTDLLFYTDFTLPRVEQLKNRVTYAIWQNGVGCNTPLQSSKEMESNRTEILRLLLTLTSKSLYMPAHIVPVRGVKALTYITTCPDKQIVLSLLCSQLNTILQYNSSTWRVPYDHVVSKNPKQCNKRFRAFIIDSERGTEFAVLVLFYALEYKTDPAKQGVVRMCVFILQTLSTEPEFGRKINNTFSTQESLPLSVKIPDFVGTYADFLIIGRLDAIYPTLLATINNVAAYLQDLSAQSSTKLMQLFASISAPSFLLANETNYALLQSLLESINAIIEHQYPNNRIFVRVLLKARRKFEALRSFTLESGQEELDRADRRRKESANGNDDSARTPSLSNVPEEGGTFTIGDDEDSDDDEEREHVATPSHSSPSYRNSQSPSRASSMDEPLPTQLRGMSEKARGKMPASQSAFSRQSSSTSLSSHVAAITSPSIGFSPSALWIESWLPTLPLHTILTLLDSSSNNTTTSIPPKTLPSAIDPSPPRVHLFSWTPLSLGWYESLLWGFIFASEMVVQKGTVGVWNGTNIRLFRVEQTAASGPTFMKPMGAVDAVGSNLVQRIGRMGVRSDTTAPARGSVRDV
ncbi:MAG: hypothetical protein Q9220_004131 [cf. Caloplaca sp. 1 TL-2023]